MDRVRLIIISFLLPLVLFSQKSNTTVSYIESSSGLSYPDWEGGRTELEFADMNGDGRMDMVTIGDHGNPYINTDQHGIIVYYGDGQGNWTAEMTGNFGYGGIAVGDVNNDGVPDLGYGMHHNYASEDLGDQILEVALSTSWAGWSAWDDGLATAGEDWGMFGTDFGDVDNDGDLDIGSISFGCCAGVHVYLNNMDGTWEHSFGFLNGNSDNIFEFGDINNDGFLDFVAGHSSGTVYFGDGTGDFILKDVNLPGSPDDRHGISTGDIDNNGSKDIAFINAAGGPEVWSWSPMLGTWSNRSGTLPASGNYEMTQLDDMNSDGYMDLFAFGEGSGTLFLGDGGGNWQQDASITTPYAGSTQAFRTGGDIDHNGKADIVLVTEEGSWPSYYNKLRCFKEASPVFTHSIRGTYPRGGEIFWQNSIRNIEWLASVPGSDTNMAILEYSVEGDEGPWHIIDDWAPNNGCYQWKVPMENSTQCHIRYQIWTIGGVVATYITPEPFTITDGTAGIDAVSYIRQTVSVWPNPFSDEIRFSFKAEKNNELDIGLTDMAGKEIHFDGARLIESGEFNEVVIYTENLLPGAYILTISDEKGFSVSTKVLKTN